MLGRWQLESLAWFSALLLILNFKCLDLLITFTINTILSFQLRQGAGAAVCWINLSFISKYNVSSSSSVTSSQRPSSTALSYSIDRSCMYLTIYAEYYNYDPEPAENWGAADKFLEMVDFWFPGRHLISVCVLLVSLHILYFIHHL